jgi:hypothetical protein
VHKRAVLPRLIGAGHRPETRLRINPWYVAASGATPPASYTTVDLSGLVPEGTREVRMQVSVTGTGTAGACVLSFRDASTTRSSDAQLTTRGEWTDQAVHDVDVPLSPDRTFAWKGSATNVTVTMKPRSLLLGVQGRATTAAVEVVDMAIPTTPGTPTVTPGLNSATLAFSASTDNVGVARYLVYSSADAYTDPVGMGTSGPITVPVVGGSPVSFKVAAVDTSGNVSAAKSAASTAVTPTTSGAVAFFADNFTRADNLTAVGNGWTQAATLLGVIGKQVALTGSGATAVTTVAVAPTALLTADQFAQMDVTAVSPNPTVSHPRLNLRYAVNGASYDTYSGYYNPPTNVWTISKVVAGTTTVLVAGTATVLGTYSASPAAGSTSHAKLVLAGSNLSMVIDGVTQAVATDTSITSAYRAGVMYTSVAATDTTGIHIDNFRAA